MVQMIDYALVAPHMGAWIEMQTHTKRMLATNVAPHMGAWIEIVNTWEEIADMLVAPHMGAWIEICLSLFLRAK